MKPPEPRTLKVEDLYEFYPSYLWSMLDDLFENRPDLHDRIKKYKDGKSIQDKTLESSEVDPKEY